MRDNKSRKGGSSKNRESKGAGTPTHNMAYDYRAPSNELFPTSVQANLRMPTGRPFLVRSRMATSSNRKVTDQRNMDVPAVQRIRVYSSFGDALLDDKFSINEWLNYAVQQMYTGLRLANRSNVNYSVEDLKTYLVQIVDLYAYAKAATTHMMCYNMTDPRVPGLQAALCFGFNNDLVVSDEAAFAGRADDTSYLPVWMRNIQESWSRAKLAADQLATLPIPARIKTYIDYLVGNVFIDQKVGGQYFKIDLSIDAVNHFPWVGEAVKSRVGQYFYEGSTSDNVWKPIAQMATALSGPTATLNTMVADLRRLEGMVPCTIDIPSDFGVLPSLVVDDDMFFDTIDNACLLNLAQEFHRATDHPSFDVGNLPNVEGVPVQPTPEMGEVRVDSTHSLDDPARLAMITSLMGVSTDLDGGAINFAMTPLVYGGTTYVHMSWYDNGLTGDYHEEYLQVNGYSYGAVHRYDTIYGNWSVSTPDFEASTVNNYAKLYNGYQFTPFANIMRLLRLGTMEHHPQYFVIRTPLQAGSNNAIEDTQIAYRDDDYTLFDCVKVLKEGTRVSIAAIRDIQYYAWASLFRL